MDSTTGLTIDRTKEILAEITDGKLIRTSPTQGGRAWLEGEWKVDELEALCVILRHEGGESGRAGPEFVVRHLADQNFEGRLHDARCRRAKGGT